MLFRPSWVAPYSWRMIEIVLYCLDCFFFKACLTWTLNSLFLQMASLRRLANRLLHEALGKGVASQVYRIWHPLEMRKVPLVIHLVKQESHRAGVGNHEAHKATQVVDKEHEPEWRVPERRDHLQLIQIPPRVGDEERARWVVEEDRGRRELRVYLKPVHMLAQVRRGPEVVELSGYLEGKAGRQVHFRNGLRPEALPKRLQTRRLQAVTDQVPVRGTIMRWYRHRGMDLPEEYMRYNCGRQLETYEHFMRWERYRGMEDPLVRDQDILLLKKGGKGRREMESRLGEERHHNGSWHMVIVKLLWSQLQEHTVVPEVVAHRLLRRTVEHLQEHMACREAQLEARAEDMRDPVTERVEMTFIGYNPQVTVMEVRPQPDWRLRQSEGAEYKEEQEGNEQREHLMAHRRKRVLPGGHLCISAFCPDHPRPVAPTNPRSGCSSPSIG